MKLKEIWNPILGYENLLYEVSNFGRVRSWRNTRQRKMKKPRILKMDLRESGYIFVSLSDNGKSINKPVSNLVLEAFVGKRPDGKEASHINGDSTDNRVINLIWETHVDNEERKSEHNTKLCGSLIGTSKLKKDDVLEIRRLDKLGLQRKVIGRLFQIHPVNVMRICRREAWAHIPRIGE